MTALESATATAASARENGTASSDSHGSAASARESGADRVTRIRQSWATDFDFDAIGARVTRLVEDGAGSNVVISGDSSQVTYDGTVHALTASTPDQLLYMPGFATLGYGIPAALGAKLADPARPVVCILGDGAAMFSIQELMTAAELGLGIPFIIVDNGGYAEIEGQMVDRDIEPFAVRLARRLREARSVHGRGRGDDRRGGHRLRSAGCRRGVDRTVPTAIHITVGH